MAEKQSHRADCAAVLRDVPSADASSLSGHYEAVTGTLAACPCLLEGVLTVHIRLVKGISQELFFTSFF